MKNRELHQFMEQIMKIQPNMPGLTGAASGILGTTGTEGMAGERLKRDALAFAAECAKPAPDSEQLVGLAQALEGSLMTVGMVSGVSDEKLDQLVAGLHALVQGVA